MRLITIISLFSILSLNLQAQDSTFVVLTEYNTLNGNLNPYYHVPALKTLNSPISFSNINASYSTQESEKYIIQKGSGYNDFKIDIESFQAKSNNFNLWGKFQYNNIKTKNVNYNETLDYDYLYPYIMSDTVGGDLRNEQYAILGGLSKSKGHSTYALEASFIGKQSTRGRDPRTNNISSNFNATLSYAYKMNEKYSLGLALIGERYFQKAKIDFNSELGRPTVFHETGLGNYNRIFADTRDNAEYLGYNYGVSIHYVPRNQLGWFASAKYISSNIQKKIKDIAFVINEANKYDFDVNIGYKHALNRNSKIEAGLSFNQNNIEGIEGKFDNKDSQVGIVKITEENLFNSDNQSIGGYISYQKINSSNTWTAKVFGQQSSYKESYVLPAAIENLEILKMGTEINFNQKFSKNTLLTKIGYLYSSPTNAEANWTGLSNTSHRYNMLSNNFNFRNTTFSQLDFSIRLAMPIKKLQTFYVGGNISYISAYNLKHFGITSGFVF